MTVHTEMDLTTAREVSPRGLRQIAEWMQEHYNDRAWENLITPDDLMRAIHAWATEAEQSENGKIEMPARMTTSGRIAYLTPDMATKPCDI